MAPKLTDLATNWRHLFKWDILISQYCLNLRKHTVTGLFEMQSYGEKAGRYANESGSNFFLQRLSVRLNKVHIFLLQVFLTEFQIRGFKRLSASIKHYSFILTVNDVTERFFADFEHTWVNQNFQDVLAKKLLLCSWHRNTLRTVNDITEGSTSN